MTFITSSEEELAVGIASYERAQFGAALATFSILAKRGVAEAQAWLGSMFANGEGTAADLPAAFEWYLRAALQGHTQ